MKLETGGDQATSFKISMGSRAKGYATPDSDDDYILFVISKKSKYLEYFTQLKLLQNQTCNKGTADEHTESDLLYGLRGVYNGNYPYLFVFGSTTNIPNRPLLDFIKQIGNLRMKLILKNLVCLDFNSNVRKKTFAVKPKQQLQKLFNLSFVDYCLKHDRCPEVDSDIALPSLLPEDFKVLYETLMMKRMSGEECSDEEVESVNHLQEQLKDKVFALKDPEEYPDVLEKIINLFL